jgi:hypothetical protein
MVKGWGSHSSQRYDPGAMSPLLPQGVDWELSAMNKIPDQYSNTPLEISRIVQQPKRLLILQWLYRQACDIIRKVCDIIRKVCDIIRKACDIIRKVCDIIRKACDIIRKVCDIIRKACDIIRWEFSNCAK